MESEKFISRKQLASILGYSPRHTRRLQDLPKPVKFSGSHNARGMFRMSEINAWLESKNRKSEGGN